MIMKMLDLSTAHIKMKTANWIDAQLSISERPLHSPIIAFPKSDYGWFIHVPSHSDDLDLEKIPADLIYLFGVARGMDCQWLCLDGDAEQDESLHLYDWTLEEEE